ncbi:Hypothetical protein, putative [Bodo saltans]|uniref:MYND-type domain-containing protein n=1 Tax=Bodo saltans TaxID=75058 RepID=A0A0S4J662_BODSA|nr:Hypothetical protein, putative [Bodo saltans]|eukprot:CUG85683.1 Hypothetical protein, putative [Bodo saltans]
MGAVFPQDQLGLLVRSHIEEQTKRFDSTEELLRSRREDLRKAELFSREDDRREPPIPSFIHTALRSSSAASTNHSNRSTIEHRNVSPTRQGSSPTLPVFPASQPESSSHALQIELRDPFSTFESHRAFCDAVEGSPVVLSLQHSIIRLENHLALMYERQEKSDARIRVLEDEKETMRLELQTLGNLCMSHSSILAELRQAISVSERRMPSLHADEKRNELRETHALLATALQEDTLTAAALIGARSSEGDKQNKKETVCDQCFSRAVCTSCGNCGSEWYCSANCALLRREKHRPACEMLRGR